MCSSSMGVLSGASPTTMRGAHGAHPRRGPPSLTPPGAGGHHRGVLLQPAQQLPGGRAGWAGGCPGGVGPRAPPGVAAARVPGELREVGWWRAVRGGGYVNSIGVLQRGGATRAPPGVAAARAWRATQGGGVEKCAIMG